MQSYDLVMIAILVGATLLGAWKGLAWQIASIGSIVLSYFAAVKFREPVSQAIKAQAPWNRFLAMLIIYIGCSLVVWIVFNKIRSTIERLKLKDFDRQIGALLGLAKGAALCVIVTLFAVTLVGDERRQTIINSRSGYYIAVLLNRSDVIMPPEIHQVLDPYIMTLDPNHQHGPSHQQHPAATPGTPASNGNNSGAWPSWQPQQPAPPTTAPYQWSTGDQRWGQGGSGIPPASIQPPNQSRSLQDSPAVDAWGRPLPSAPRTASDPGRDWRQLPAELQERARVEVQQQVRQQIDRYLPSPPSPTP